MASDGKIDAVSFYKANNQDFGIKNYFLCCQYIMETGFYHGRILSS